MFLASLCPGLSTCSRGLAADFTGEIFGGESTGRHEDVAEVCQLVQEEWKTGA